MASMSETTTGWSPSVLHDHMAKVMIESEKIKKIPKKRKIRKTRRSSRPEKETDKTRRRRPEKIEGPSPHLHQIQL